MGLVFKDQRKGYLEGGEDRGSGVSGGIWCNGCVAQPIKSVT